MSDSNFQNNLNNESNSEKNYITTQEGSDAIDKTTKNTPRSKQLMLFVVSVIVVSLVVYFVLQSHPKPINKDNTSEINKIALKEVKATVEHLVEVTPVIPKVVTENSDTASELNKELPEKEFLTTIESDAIEQPQISLDESDLWLSSKLESLISSKNLVNLVITEGLIRRFVIFTDSMTRGEVIYKYSPLQSPGIKFSLNESDDSNNEDIVNQANKKIKSWQWDESTTDRFTTYIDLVSTLSTKEYLALYREMKPLIDQVYSELGYPSDDFTYTLIDALNHIIDFKMPIKTLALTRSSVMYKFKDESVESLQDIDKLLIRLGDKNMNKLVPLLINIRDELAQSDK